MCLKFTVGSCTHAAYFSRHLDLMKVRMINADVVMMRTAHRTITASIDRGSSPMEDLINPATFDVGIMMEIQLKLPSWASEK